MRITFFEWDGTSPTQHLAAALGSDEVQVWTARMPKDDTASAKLAAVISPDERERAERFLVSEPRREFIFARAALRHLLGACLQIAPASLVFGQQSQGKPFLLQPNAGHDVAFNLSHSGGMLAIALGRGREIGVDIEFIHGLADFRELAPHFFSPRELAELHALPKTQQRAAFFNGWTRKEAWLKATGEGLTDSLPRIQVTLTPGMKPDLLGVPGSCEAARWWSMAEIPLPPDFAGAVVFSGSKINKSRSGEPYLLLGQRYFSHERAEGGESLP